jgi:type VI secretion system protein ImpE
MNAREHYEAGRLGDALTALRDEVKKAPGNPSPRSLFCELLAFAGDLERADTHLDALGQLEPQGMVAVSLFRQLLRAEQARQQFYTEGRLPDFLGEPTPVLKLYLEASILLRDGQHQEANRLLRQAEEQRPHPAGVCNGQPFADFRDLDDLTASFFEVYTSNGKYYWIPVEQVELVEFHKPARPRDLLWRRAHMIVRGGPDGEVFLPALYAGTHLESDDTLRLGRATDWSGGDGTPVRGKGQRTFLVGEESLTILDLQEMNVNAS